MIRTVFGSNKSGTALIPIFDTINMALNISTRSGDSVITMGDGSSSISRTNPKFKDFTDGVALAPFTYNYASAFTGNISIKYLKGLKDVYSVWLGNTGKGNNNTEKYNITDLETFFNQFPNLYSIYITEYAYQTPSRMSIIKGDLAKLPNSVERVLIENAEILNAATDFVLNFSSYTNTSLLKYFNFTAGNNQGASTIKVIGDLGKLPTSCQFLYLKKASSGSAITYTAGKVWASSFDTLYLPIPLGVFENDALLIDLKNSVTSLIGGKVFYLGGGYRTSASDSAVTYLTGLGGTVSGVSKLAYTPAKILDLPLQNNFTDYSTSGISMVAGNANGLPSFVSDGSGGYALDFTGTKSIKTAVNLPINTSDKVSIKFILKTGNTRGVIVELSSNFDGNNAFSIEANKGGVNINVGSHTTTYNELRVSVTQDSWNEYIAIIDRASTLKLYRDGVLIGTFTSTQSGNFGNYTLFIGQRGGSSTGLIGQLQYLKIYNYPIL